MNKSTIVFLANDDVKAIKATYEDNAKEVIFKTFNTDLSVDDLVIVPTSTRHGFTIVKITEINVEVDLDDSTHIDWVVDYVHTDQYRGILSDEQKLVETVISAEKRRKRDALKKAIFQDNEAITSLAISSNTEVID